MGQQQELLLYVTSASESRIFIMGIVHHDARTMQTGALNVFLAPERDSATVMLPCIRKMQPPLHPLQPLGPGTLT